MQQEIQLNKYAVYIVHMYTHAHEVLFADDQEILQKSENELHRSIFHLNKLCMECNMEISLKNTK